VPRLPRQGAAAGAEEDELRPLRPLERRLHTGSGLLNRLGAGRRRRRHTERRNGSERRKHAPAPLFSECRSVVLRR
jgi:hypothetical protein